MNFSELYKNNKAAVEKTLRSLWCGETNNDSQKAYVEQLETVIGKLFAPENAVPLVQCMNSYQSVHSVSPDEAKSLVGSLWSSNFAPYEHQYQCWDTLLNGKTEDGKPMSICVTTGTGSGKTECFMMPLVHDLDKKNISGEVQAIFLYPLNALMEDQKTRLEELLKGTNLTYAVYNGDLPESEPSPTDNSEEAKRLRRQIALIRGEYEENGETKYRFPKILYTRKMVRAKRPNILLTNPTMLEYILLRGTDSKLIDPEKKSLKWIAIDETHTYTGAGAAELAMLLRRVLLAFNVTPDRVQFATSSATFSNSEPGSEQAKADELDLRKFISGITGVGLDQVKVISGVRLGEKELPSAALSDEDKSRWDLLLKADYIELDKLFPGPTSIEEKLQLFDDMCSRAEGLSPLLMKAKVHYFYRVPNNGLFVRLSEHTNGAFHIYDQNIADENEGNAEPLLELCRCKHCGEYVAVAMQNTADGSYESFVADDSDMFDLTEEESSDDMKFTILGLSNTCNTLGDNNAILELCDGKLEPVTAGTIPDGTWHIVGNTQHSCPFCNSKLSHKKAEEENELLLDIEEARLAKFRLSADFISRVIAPSTLDQLDKVPSPTEGEVLHDGQQYISFVDSRQAAAKTTLKQNLEQERLWFYSTIYHELLKRKAENNTVLLQIEEVKKQINDCEIGSEEWMALVKKMSDLKDQIKDFITWKEIAKILEGSDGNPVNAAYCRKFAELFVKRSLDSDETDDEGNIKPAVIRQYVQSLMVMYLSKRPSSALAPETVGLFQPHYTKIEDIKTIPAEVEQYNNLITDPRNKIELKDWKNLLQIFIDYTVRSNQSVFLKLDEDDKIDILSSVRFATSKAPRRSVKKPEISESVNSRVIQYLGALLTRDNPSISVSDSIKRNQIEIQAVIDAMWQNLLDIKLLEQGQTWDTESNRFVDDKDVSIRLNLANMSFKLFENVYLCDTNIGGEAKHARSLRTVETNFKKFAPYLQSFKPVELKDELFEKWEPFPYYVGSGAELSPEDLAKWASENRKLLWENSLWGENGTFADRLEEFHLAPRLFVQAEHTAQVDKVVSRQLQTSFKEHKINILACSTTMEMGVDLGNLEVVMLQSVPPQPSNYKQRAGRSGRNNKVRSVCITLCNSDIIGLRTLYKPLEHIINRPVAVPKIDLMSPQVVQRHVNSFLVRNFGVFSTGAKGGSLNQKVVDFYTPFEISHAGTHLNVVDENEVEKTPTDLLGDKTNTLFALFDSSCEKELTTPTAELRTNMSILLKDTVFDGKFDETIKMAKKENERCYSELFSKISDYKFAYEDKTRPFKSDEQRKKFLRKLKLQYIEVLNQRLLTFWSTSRFTPNANMPVNVLSFDINTTGNKSFYSTSTSSNPSYSLREAIAQYAPGNCIVVDGVVYTVRGIEYTNFYQGINNFKKIYRNMEKTVIGEADGQNLSSKIIWGVNGRDDLELVQPLGFVPDMNERTSRIMDVNKYTRVSAQLIDTQDWDASSDNDDLNLLYSIRNNRDTGNAKILYYNEGDGFGYCLCPMCGKMVLETEVAEDDTTKLPFEMNDRYPKDKTKPRYHLAIRGREAGKFCGNSNNKKAYKRNVIIGDLIQTDFSEIRIRHRGMTRWISNRDAELNLLYTLGIVFTQSLADVLGKERGAIDFAIMPNGHICIFDTNPGGAGYSNQLTSPDIMKQVLDSSRAILKNAASRKSKDLLLDKFTLRYYKYIDLAAALDWFDEMGSTPSSSSGSTRGTKPNIVIVTYTAPYESFHYKGRIVLQIDINNRTLKSSGWSGREEPLSAAEEQRYLDFFCNTKNLVDFFNDKKAYSTKPDTRFVHTRWYELNIMWNSQFKSISVGYPDIPFKHPFLGY